MWVRREGPVLLPPVAGEGDRWHQPLRWAGGEGGHTVRGDAAQEGLPVTQPLRALDDAVTGSGKNAWEVIRKAMHDQQGGGQRIVRRYSDW
jgi:hypothetical protein